MATISSLAVDIHLNPRGVRAGVLAVLSDVQRMAKEHTNAGRMVQATESATAKAVQATGEAYKRAREHANGYLKTILGISAAGAGAAMIGNAVKTFSAAQDRSKEIADADKLSTVYARLRRDVELTNETFGGAFARSANLAGIMQQLRSALQRLQPLFSAAGSALGYIVALLDRLGPVSLVVYGTFKLLGVVVGAFASAVLFLAQVVLLRLITQFVTFHLLGTAMTPWMIAKVALTWAWAGACWGLNAAITAINFAIGVLTAIGAPVWVAIRVVVVAVAAVVWGLYRAYQWLFNSTPVNQKTIKELEGLEQKLEDTRKAAQDTADALQLRIDQAGMTESEKMLDDFKRKLEEFEKAGGGDQAAALAAMKAKIEKKEAENKQRQANDTIEGLRKELRQLGMTEMQKRLDDMVLAGADSPQLALARDILVQIERKTKEFERQADLAREIEAIEKETASVGLSDIEKRLAGMRELGATAKQIADAEEKLKAADEKIRSIERQKSLSEEIARIEKEAAQVGLTEAQKRLALLKEMGATEQQIADARKKLDAIESASKSEETANRVKQLYEDIETPLEAYRKKIADIAQLQRIGAINAQIAKRAMDAADKDLVKEFGGGRSQASSPQALLKGSAEAALAANRDRNPVEKMTELQRQELAEARKTRQGIEAMNALIQKTRDLVAQF